MAESMTLEEALVVCDQASPLPAKAHLALQVLRAEVDQLRALKEPARESRMVVICRNPDGTPSVWCDPEIVDLVAALNDGGVPTVTSCSGHGHRPGTIGLADGRWLVVAKDDEERKKIDALFPVDINGVTRQTGTGPVAELVSDGLGGARISWLSEDYFPIGTQLFAGPQHEATSKPTQVLRVTRERRAVHGFRLLDGRLLEIPEDSYRVELLNAAGPTDAYYPAKCSGRDPSPGPDNCRKVLPGDNVVVKLTTGLQEPSPP